jgi:hypothetical protein
MENVMTHDELMAKILEFDNSCNTSGSDKEVPKSSGWDCYELHSMASALRAVVELHKPNADGDECANCGWECGKELISFPCPTIQAIEKELK